MNGSLKPRHRAFVEAMLGEAKGNGTKAAKLAGYSGDDATLAVTASRLLRNDNIRESLEAISEKTPGVKKRKDLQRFWSDVIDDPEQAMRDRLKASELMGKSRRMFVERREITGKNGKAINLNVATVSDEYLEAIIAEAEEANGNGT